jgi:hypothetical protein
MKWLNCAKTKVLLFGFVAVITLCVGSARADFTFTEPVNLGPTVNSSSLEGRLSLSADGLSLYFSSNRSLGEGGLYVTTRLTKNDDWSTPVNLGVSGSGGYIAPDGLSLIFASDYDVWVTTRRTTSDPWREPINLGQKTNEGLWAAVLCPDGTTFLLVYLDRPGDYGSMDI